jgi:predicted nicotinamide N-methyase
LRRVSDHPGVDERLDLVRSLVRVGGREVRLLQPRDPEALLDEEAFEHEEFLPYWADLWPSALVLAEELGRRPLEGVRVAELGCGLGVPSLVAALGGARVLATDWAPDAIDVLRANAARNAVDLCAERCDWNEPGLLLGGAPWPLVVAADVLYDRRNVAPLLALLPRLVDGAGEVWLADPGRKTAEPFLAKAAERWARATLARAGAVTVHRLWLRA